MMRYVVQPGDTLSKIAARFYGDAGAYRRIATANQIINPDMVLIGQTLRLPGLDADGKPMALEEITTSVQPWWGDGPGLTVPINSNTPTLAPPQSTDHPVIAQASSWLSQNWKWLAIAAAGFMIVADAKPRKTRRGRSSQRRARTRSRLKKR